jgi:beta-RFAP synthase
MGETGVRVVAHARLHFGQIDLHGGLGRRFGSIGVAVEAPQIVLDATPAKVLHVEGHDAERVRHAAEQFARATGTPVGARIHVRHTIPAHVGLGSGTQLAMATGLALARLAGRDADVWHLARLMRRGERSGIGIGAFALGGFLVDGGVPASTPAGEVPLPPLLFRHPFPPQWWAVLAVPQGHQGVSGTAEDRAFASAPPMAPDAVGRICRLLVMQMLPALLEQDLRTFGAALTEIQTVLGDYFAGIQGGRFSTPVGARLAAHMLEGGAAGVGQSSWGPTVYGLVEGEDAARALARSVAAAVPPGERVEVLTVRAANTGATCVPLAAQAAAGSGEPLPGDHPAGRPP